MQSSTTPESGADDDTGVAAELLDHLFRRHAGLVQARLIRAFGAANLQLAEDAVQEAQVKALRQWSYRGPPSNPGGWIYRVARNYAIDQLRREQRTKPLDQAEEALEDGLEVGEEAVFADDQLTLMFLCCHPIISPDAAVALTLKTVCGFGVSEIARAYFAEETAIRQRLVRAKRALRLHAVDLSIPDGSALEARRTAVLRALYLMFNEGYSVQHGAGAVNAEVCAEAIRLTSLLAACELGDTPQTHALLALMLLQAARFDARMDASGEVVLLVDQDRRLWNQKMIVQGLEALAGSAQGAELSNYHLEAGIAACHAVAASVEETDWARIVDQYDALLARTNSAVVALNRAVALAHLDGPVAAQAALATAGVRTQLARYHHYHATVGELARRCGDHAAAIAAFQRAYDLSTNAAERRLLERRILAERFALDVRSGVPT